MRLGISSYTYGWACGAPGRPVPRPLRPMDLLERAHSLEVGVLQICDNAPLDALSPDELDALQARAEEWDIAIEIGTRGIDQENIARHIALAQRFGSPILRSVIDTPDDRPTEDQIVARIKTFVPDLETAGVCLAIENHDRFKAVALANIVERIGSDKVGICLDSANSFGALEGPQVVVETLGPYAVNLHLKGFIVRRFDHNMGFAIQGCPLGQGDLDVPWVLDALRQMRRDVNAIIEQWTPPEARLDETIRKEETWAAESVRYLRTLIPD